ncbi:hypothetical protein [Peribacillus butanolivorans]|uniref:hypothetical protein n=1 Tax=Peribacillus butanolivorans TaxID=421767 RepID=UPI0036711A40
MIIAFGGIRLLRHFTNARLEVATTIEGDLKNITNHKEEHGAIWYQLVTFSVSGF